MCSVFDKNFLALQAVANSMLGSVDWLHISMRVHDGLPLYDCVTIKLH